MLKQERLEIEITVQGFVLAEIPKRLPPLNEFRAELSAHLVESGFRAWVIWPKGVQMNSEYSQALHRLGNVIEEGQGQLWISGVRPKDRKMIADGKGPRIEWIR